MDYASARIHLTSPRSIFLSIAILLSLSPASGCRRAPLKALRPATLEATFSGCSAIVTRESGVVCELGPSRTLRFVTAEGNAAFSAYFDAASTRTETAVLPVRETSDAAHVYRIIVPPGAERVVLRGRESGQDAIYTLLVGAEQQVPWLEQARAARVKGDLAQARALAQAHFEVGPEYERTAACDLLARIALSEGRAADAFPLFREAMHSHAREGRISQEVDDAFAYAFALHQRSYRYEEARSVLDAIAPRVPLYPEGAARAPYYRGVLASETGDSRTALALLREAESRASHLGMTRLVRNARAAQALELQVLGRSAASLMILDLLDKDPEVKGCERLEIANDLAWGALLAAEASPDQTPRNIGLTLHSALSDPTCSDAYLRSFALGNLARYEIAVGDLDAASKHLADARAAVSEPRGTEHLAWLDLEARILLGRHQPAKALARFEEEWKLARAASLLQAQWSALVGQSDALIALRRPSDAIRALLEAEDVLDRALESVPLGEGRGSFVAEHARSTRRAIEFLARLGRNDEAARVAKQSRMRLLRTAERATRIESLSAQERAHWDAAIAAHRKAREALDAEAAGDWQLPADELAEAVRRRRERERVLHTAFELAIAVLRGPASEALVARTDPPREGDLEIVIHPADKDWIAFATDAQRTSSHRLPDPHAPQAQLEHALFDPISDRLRKARRVRIRAYGEWAAINVHALEFEGVPLLDKVAVDYPVGLRSSSHASFERRALVVGDPDDTLASARLEARSVAASLSRTMPVSLLLGSAATSQAVGEQLPHAALFHYAGHAVQSTDGFSSRIELSNGGHLTVADFLGLAPAPRKAVLLGCNAAQAMGDSDGIGIAQSLVAAGSEEVLAPTTAVNDAFAQSLAAALYDGEAATWVLDLDTSGSLAHAARLAILRARARDPSSAWQAFRVLAR